MMLKTRIFLMVIYLQFIKVMSDTESTTHYETVPFDNKSGLYCEEIEVSTPDNLEYKLYPAPVGIFKFKVRAANDAHIALCSENGETGTMFEVVIGGWSNSKSVIRKNKAEPDLVEVSISNILHPGEFRGFWICWHDSVITVGKEGENNALLVWKDDDLIQVNYVGIHTGYGASGTWLIDKERFQVPAPKLGLTASNCFQASTPDSLEYKLYPAPGGVFKFKVRAANDAHIALCSENGETGPMFEVVIGGWSNSKSVIRKNKAEPDLVEVRIPNILHPAEFRGFWICWYDSVITVGKEGEDTAFLVWKDEDFIRVNYVGIHTGFGASGTWLINKEQFKVSAPILGLTASNCFQVSTPDNLEYKLYPAPGGVFKFKVRAANDAHIALCSENGETGPMFEVVIGGWSNSKSVLRKNKTQPDLVEVRIPNLLHPGEFRGFWICWYDSVITVGKEGEDNAFLVWKDEDFIPVNYVGIHTGFGASGTWLINKEQFKLSAPMLRLTASNCFQVSTPDNLEYKLYPAPGGVFKFKVRAANDAHIALCSENGETGPMFEVVIGGWSNSKSVLRRNKTQPDLVEVRIPNLLHPGEFRGFWICWYDSVITVGKEGEDNAFLVWKDEDFIPVNYVGIHTGFGASGTWLIDKDCIC